MSNRKPFSYHLSEETFRQLETLSDYTGKCKKDVIALAVERYFNDFMGKTKKKGGFE